MKPLVCLSYSIKEERLLVYVVFIFFYTLVNEFKPIDVKELPQAVKDAIKKDYAESTVKEAAVKVAEGRIKNYKVTLVDAAGTESAVLFNEKGEVLK